MAKKSTPDSVLGTFDGKDVVTSSVKITNAGDGLSSALSIDPRPFHHREVVTVVLQCEVTQVNFIEVKDTDRLARVHTLRAGIATIIDPTLVEHVLETQRRKNEEAAGVQRIPGFDEIDPESDIPE